LIKTKVFKIKPRHQNPRAIEFCVRVLRRGGVVAFPTETVYGLGANFLDRRAVDKIYRVKRRPRAKALTIQVADTKMIEDMGCRITPVARKLMKRFWPGPLTIILKSPSGETLGFRIPKNEVALRLIRRAGFPLVVPSANVSGSPPAKDAESVFREFKGKIDAILDGGSTDIGIESTVIDVTGSRPKILRHGVIGESAILRAAR
jgi:L-threonylcarbamoyladenylate synthase